MLRRLLPWLALMWLAPVAWAQGWQIQVLTGWYLPRRADLHLTQSELTTDLWLRQVPFRGRSLDTPFYYVLRVRLPWSSRWIRPVSAEIEFTHAKAYAAEAEEVRVEGQWQGAPLDLRAPFHNYVQSFSLSHGLNFLFGNGLFQLGKIGASRISLRAGGGILIPHVENQLEGHWVQKYQLAGLGYQLGLDLDWPLSGRWRLLLAPRWSRARLSRMDAYRGRIATTLDGFHLDVGLARVL